MASVPSGALQVSAILSCVSAMTVRDGGETTRLRKAKKSGPATVSPCGRPSSFIKRYQINSSPWGLDISFCRFVEHRRWNDYVFCNISKLRTAVRGPGKAIKTKISSRTLGHAIVKDTTYAGTWFNELQSQAN